MHFVTFDLDLERSLPFPERKKRHSVFDYFSAFFAAGNLDYERVSGGRKMLTMEGDGLTT